MGSVIGFIGRPSLKTLAKIALSGVESVKPLRGWRDYSSHRPLDYATARELISNEFAEFNRRVGIDPPLENNQD